jgi:hypothetical protein
MRSRPDGAADRRPGDRETQQVELNRFGGRQCPPQRVNSKTLTEPVLAQVRLLRNLHATIADLDRALAAGLVGHAKAKLLAPCPASARSTSPRSSLRLAPSWSVSTPPSRPSPSAAPPRSPGPPATPRRGFRWAAEQYADARRRGKHHPHAIRILARAWLRVIWACWHTDTAYNPARHRAEQRLTA